MKTIDVVKTLACALLTVLVFVTGGSIRAAQRSQQPSAAALDVQKLRDNVFVIKGGGGNSTVFVASMGVVLVDAKMPGWGTPLLDKIKTLTDKPVIVLINTHSHADHTSGNVEMPTGVEIIASENTKKNMEDMDFFKKPENAKGLPTKTFKDKMTLFSGADEVDLYWFGPGETSGDTYVVFPSAHVVVVEDQFPSQTMHIVNTVAGGSAVKFPDTLAKAVATIKGADTVVTGHDGVLTFDDFKLWAKFQREFLDWVEAERKAGKTVDEATAEYKIPDSYQGYGPAEPRRVKGHIQGIYDELDGKKD
jgi:cyclase